MDLVNRLIEEGHLKSSSLIRAFRRIQRTDFVPDNIENLALLDQALPIGFGQTISQPSTVAFMLELLQPHEGDFILDVGSGSGWTVGLLAEAVGTNGKVFGIELIPELCRFAEHNIDKYGFIDNGRAKVFCQDGYLGLPESAPFDKIIIAAAAPKIPQALLDQLKVDGRLVLPVGEPHQSQTIISIIKNADGTFNEEAYPGFIFVPLVKK